MTANYFDLSTGSFTENWSGTGRIGTNDDWSGVASIVGYRGDGLTAATGVDPQTITGDSAVINVIANQTNPTTFNTGGVAEFEIADPTIALNGSGTADAPYIALYLNAAARQDITLSFNVRDLDGSVDNAIQQISVQYRTAGAATWTNLPSGFVADATSGPSLNSLVTPVSLTLPAEAADQGQLEVRILTTNAVGNDEWVGIDDIVVASAPIVVTPALGAGAIAFTGFNADGNDDLAFVALVDIPAGTVITFEDNEWNGAAFADTNENAFSWTATSTVAAGTVVQLTSVGSNTGISANIGTAGYVAGEGSNHGSGNSDEVIYAYVGTAANPTFLTAVANGGFSAANGVLTGTGLTAGLTALDLSTLDDDADIAAYVGPRSGQATFADYGAALNSPTAASWLTQDAGGDQSIDGTAPDVPFSTAAFTLGGGSPGSVSIADVAITEGAAGTQTATFTLTRSGGTGAFSVDFATADGSATIAGGDYLAAAGTVNFAVGDTTQTVTVTINGDSAFEPNESFVLNLSNATGGASITDAQALGVITNDDVDPTAPPTILPTAPSLEGTGAPLATNAINLVRIGSITASGNNALEGGSEVVAYEATTGRIFSQNTRDGLIEISQIGADGALTSLTSVSLTGLTNYGGVNSVAIKNGVMAVAYGATDHAAGGYVALYDTATLTLQKTVQVGVLPDQVVFTPDGLKILTANEGEAISSLNNPDGSVSIIDLSGGLAAASVVNTIGFTSLNGSEAALTAAGLQLFPGQSASADIEPEYITISPDGTRAYVTLQEVNAVAVIDLTNPTADRPISILPLGYVDHTLAGNAFDPNDQDGVGQFVTANIRGLQQPDAIASFSVGGATYFVTANEGDSRVGGLTDSARLSSSAVVLDPTAFPDAAAMKASAMGRLNVFTQFGDTDGDGDIDQLYTLGGRGISIFKQEADGTITKVRETGGEFEQIIARDYAAIFNQNQSSNPDGRSDDKGPEPEGVTIGAVNGHLYAFVTLERTGGIMVYDVTDPANASFVQFHPPVAGTDNGPEVVTFVSAAESPTGTALVLSANEISGNTTVYAIAGDQQVRFDAGSVAVSHAEGNAGATTDYVFTVERTGGALGDLSFTGSLSLAGADAADFGGALPTFSGVIPAGATSVQVTVSVSGDVVAEANESFSITLATATNSRSGEGFTASVAAIQAVATGTIANDDFTHIYDIQGSGHLSALAGQTVTTQGVVTAVDTNGSRGFYIQDVSGDGNVHTSDAVFVFLPSGALPTVGHLVSVTGTVTEFVPAGADPGVLSTTEIGFATFTDLGVGPAIAAVQIGGVGGLLPPTEDLAQGALFYEGLEGMLVKVAAPRSTGPTNSFGEIFTVVDNDADPSNGYHGTNLTPRGNIIVSGGAPAFGDTNTTGGDFNPERIQIDDDNGVFAGAPTPKVDTGAVLNDVTGILRYDFGNYEVIATQAITVAQASTLTKEVTTLVGDASHLTIAAYNAENLDPGDPVARFTILASEIVNTLKSSDIISMQEIQDNDGATNSAVIGADVTLSSLVDKVNALEAAAGSSAHYAYLDNPFIGDDTNGGEPGGNIRNAFIYRDDRVQFVAGSLRSIANADQQTNPDSPFYGSRPPLVADFMFNGQVVTVVDVHFTSKGGSAVLLGSDQPPFNAGEVQRAAQAQAVNNFIDGLLAINPNAKIVLAGDFNEYAFEEPINVLKGTASISNYDTPGADPYYATATYTPGGSAVLTDLQDLLPANEHFDYVFEGNSQSLDHAFVTNNLAAGAQFDVVRINADFANQTSDHDPLVASFLIPAGPPAALAITTATPSANEGASGSTPFTFHVARTGDLSTASTVQYAVSGGPTITPGDFNGALTGSVSFAAGETQKDIVVNVKGDGRVEADESFVVTLSTPTGATIGTASASAIIVNDDASTGVTAGNNTISATASFHELIGLAGSDTFQLSKASFGAPSVAPPAPGTINFIADFQGAGGWTPTNNDTVAVTGFSAGAVLHFGAQSAEDAKDLYYYVEDAGQKYWFGLHSENGKMLNTTQDVFLWHP